MLSLLFYDVVDDYVSRRAPYRERHLALAKEYADRGQLLLGGAFAEPIDGAMLIFTSETDALAFVSRDPYVEHGLITAWKVRQWNAVAGSQLR
jgi:uncharacterized protein YciI